MASYVLPASRAGIVSVVTTPTTTLSYVVPLNVITVEAASGSSGGATTQALVMVLA